MRNSESLAMKNALRRDMNKVRAKSTLERWIGAMSTGPVAGMFSRPLTRGRKKSHASTDTSPATRR